MESIRLPAGTGTLLIIIQIVEDSGVRMQVHRWIRV